MKLLASDYDGTLFRNSRIDKEDITAICKFKEKGNLFGIVTGRSFGFIERELNKNNIPYDFIICINGGYIEDRDKNVIYEKQIPLEIANQIVEQVKNEKIQLGIICDGILSEVFVFRMKIIKTIAHFFHHRLYQYQLKPRNRKIVRNISIHAKEEKYTNEIIEKLQTQFNDYIECNRNGETIIDVSGKGTAKENAVQRVADYFGVSDIYVIGDSYNDIEMIRAFDGFAISNANEEVLSIAKKEFSNFKAVVEYII